MPLNNHIFVAGQEGYQDNSAVVAFDPEKAKQELDALGWRMNGQFREKDGRQLVIRDVLYDAQTTRQIGQIAQNSLAQIGVKLDLDAKGGAGFFTNYITVGDFDIAQFAWVRRRVPAVLPDPDLRHRAPTATSARSAARRSTPRSSRRSTNSTRPRRATLANELDKLIWAEGFSLPLFQSPGNVAVRSTLANFGAFGLGRRGLHQDRLHEAVTRCTVRGTAAGNACSTAAAAAMPQINSRTPRPPGVESSFLARAGRPELVPS